MRLAMTLLAAALASPAVASEHCATFLDQGYICARPLAEAVPPGTLSNLSPGVLLPGNASFAPGASQFGLAIGDRVAIPAGEQAELTFGPTCQRQLGPDRSLILAITEAEGCALASLVENREAAAVIDGTGWILAGSVLLLGGGAAVLLTTDSGSVSP